VNVAWHLLVVFCLYALGLSMPVGLNNFPGKRSVVFWSVLLFAVHPLNTHSVTWISGRKDVMCAAFSLVALLALLRVGRDGSRRGDVLRCLLAGLALLLALGSKELALMVPVVALLVPFVVWYFSSSLLSVRRQCAAVAVLWLTAGLYLAYRFAFVGPIRLVAEDQAYGLSQRIRMASTLLYEYVGRILLPRLPAVSDAWPLSPSLEALHILALIGVLVMAVLLLVSLYKKQLIALPLFWFAIWMAPASGLAPLAHVRAERYLYPASWGLILATVMAVAWCRARFFHARSVPLLRCIPPLAVLLLIAMTAYSNTLWWNDARLFGHSLGRDPHHAEAHLALAKLALDDGDFSVAERHARQAVAVASGRTHAAYISPLVAQTNLGLALYHQDRFKSAQEHFQKALEARPDNATANYHMGLAAMSQRQWTEAQTFFERAMQLNADDQLARSNLAYVCLRLGKLQACVELYRPLIESGSTDPLALNNYGSALLAMRQYAQARRQFERVLELQPEDAVAMAKLAWCLSALDQRDEAMVVLRRARQLAPHDEVVGRVQRMLERP